MADTTTTTTEKKEYIKSNYQGQYDDKLNDLYTKLGEKNEYDQKLDTLYGNLGKPNAYDAKVDDLYNQIAGRQPFQYNASDDALYQQYVDRYMQGGKQAMRDTVGQAAALTGGYTNSYAQRVGQQTYDQYLQGLNDKLTEMYGLALDQYNMEGNRLNNLFGMAGDLANRDRDIQRDLFNTTATLADNQYGRLKDQFSMAGALSDSEYERLWQEATTRQQLGDNSLLRQLVGMPEQAAAVAYDPWGYGNGNEGSGGSKSPSGLYQSGVTIWNSGSNTINNDLTAAYRVDNPHATGYVSDSSLRRDIT